MMLKQGYPVHRAYEDGDIHHPVVKWRLVEPRRHQAHGCATRDILNKLFHAEVYNG